MNKDKNKKRLIAIPFGIVLIFCILNLLSHRYVAFKAENYICSKYDVAHKEVELVDYNQAHPCFEEYEIFFQKLVWVDFSFEFKMNDRNFVVIRNHGKFYDDYQFEDVELWCAQWLQKNIDNRIIYFGLSTDDFVNYLKNAKGNNKYIITSDDAEDFIKHFEIEENVASFYSYDPSFKQDTMLMVQTGEEIRNKTTEVLGPQYPFLNTYADKTYSREIHKYDFDLWVSVLN